MRTLLAKLVVVALLVAAAAVGGAFYLGILDWESATTRVRAGGANAVADAVGSIAGAGGAGGANARAGAPACRDNIRRIEAAKRAVATPGTSNIGGIDSDAVLKELGGKLPVCPAGGSYLLGTNEQMARCSIGANGTTDPGDDHVIAAF